MTLSMEFTTWYAIKPDITRFKPDLNLQLRNSQGDVLWKNIFLEISKNSQENTY